MSKSCDSSTHNSLGRAGRSSTQCAASTAAARNGTRRNEEVLAGLWPDFSFVGECCLTLVLEKNHDVSRHGYWRAPPHKHASLLWLNRVEASPCSGVAVSSPSFSAVLSELAGRRTCRVQRAQVCSAGLSNSAMTSLRTRHVCGSWRVGVICRVVFYASITASSSEGPTTYQLAGMHASEVTHKHHSRS